MYPQINDAGDFPRPTIIYCFVFNVRYDFLCPLCSGLSINDLSDFMQVLEHIYIKTMRNDYDLSS